MSEKTHLAGSADSVLLAYGREVGELLSSASAENWTAELWTMFGGYILALQELGNVSGLPNTFSSFKELLEFFEKVDKIRLAGT